MNVGRTDATLSGPASGHRNPSPVALWSLMGDQPTFPELVVNPSADQALRDLAEDVLHHLERPTPADLERLLRKRYPNAVARARDLTGEAAVWYVYREGHWVPPAG